MILIKANIRFSILSIRAFLLEDKAVFSRRVGRDLARGSPPPSLRDFRGMNQMHSLEILVDVGGMRLSIVGWRLKHIVVIEGPRQGLLLRLHKSQQALDKVPGFCIRLLEPVL